MSIETLRQYRVGGYALFDLSISFLGIYLLSPFLSKVLRKLGWEIPRSSWLMLTLPIGILVHLLTGTETLMTKNFMDPQGQVLLKLFIIGLFVMGIKGVQKRDK